MVRDDTCNPARPRGRRQPQPAPLRVEHCTEEAHLLHLLHQLVRVDVVMLELHHLRPDFLLEPAVDGVQQRGFFGGISVSHVHQ